MQMDRKDIKNSKEKCGLEYAMDKLNGLEGVGCIYFTQDDIVRNPIISKILDRWNN